jgi:Erv1 / Alr family
MELDLTEQDLDWDVKDLQNEGKDQFAVVRRAIEAVLGKSSMVVPYYRRTREELKADIHKSFDFAMRDGVFSSNDPLDTKSAAVLKDFLLLLHQTLPASWDLHELLGDLIKDFNYVSKHEAYLYNILDQYPPPSKVWSPACSHGDPDAGFTCGLWEMFHAMTVGLVDYNNLVHEKHRVAPEDASRKLRDYLEHFFGCSDCRQNFLAMYDSCGYNRCNRLDKDTEGLAKDKLLAWAQLPLWLFEVHNGVNVRLLKERAERQKQHVTLQDEIDVLWPPQRDCLPCWNNDAQTCQVTPNHTNIYKWLHLEYGQRDSNSGDVKRDLVREHKAMEKKLKLKQSRIKLTNSSMVVGLYVLILLGVKIQRRNIIGRAKKLDDNVEKADKHDESPSDPTNTKASPRLRKAGLRSLLAGKSTR